MKTNPSKSNTGPLDLSRISDKISQMPSSTKGETIFPSDDVNKQTGDTSQTVPPIDQTGPGLKASQQRMARLPPWPIQREQTPVTQLHAMRKGKECLPKHPGQLSMTPQRDRTNREACLGTHMPISTPTQPLIHTTAHSRTQEGLCNPHPDSLIVPPDLWLNELAKISYPTSTRLNQKILQTMTFKLEEGHEGDTEVATMMTMTMTIGMGIIWRKANRRATPRKRIPRTLVARCPTKVLPVSDKLAGDPPFPLAGITANLPLFEGHMQQSTWRRSETWSGRE